MNEMRKINSGNEEETPPLVYHIAQSKSLLTSYPLREDRSCSLNKLTITLRTRMSIETQAVILPVTDASSAWRTPDTRQQMIGTWLGGTRLTN